MSLLRKPEIKEMKKLLLFIMTLAPFAGIAQGTESGDITFDVGIQAGI